tara:strand:+ start:541 stop:963 length:423 start_codon:yes stop_codon:yes gene_type:complete
MQRRRMKYQEGKDPAGTNDEFISTRTYSDPREELLQRVGNYALLATGIADRLRVDPNMRSYMPEANRILTIQPYELGLSNAFPTYDVGDNRFYKDAFIPVGDRAGINYGYDYDVDRGNFGLSFNFNTPMDLFALKELKDY